MSIAVAAKARPVPVFPPILALWALTAACVTAAGWVTVERRFAVPLTVATTTVATLVASGRDGAFGAWARALPLPKILAFQALRAPIGVAFLLWAARGVAPADFATGAGWGDLAVGVLATCLLGLGDDVVRRRRLLFGWNVLGLVDIALVVVAAQARFVLQDPASLRGLLATPFPMLPLFYVPLVIVSHVVIFRRLASASSPRSPSVPAQDGHRAEPQQERENRDDADHAAPDAARARR